MINGDDTGLHGIIDRGGRVSVRSVAGMCVATLGKAHSILSVT